MDNADFIERALTYLRGIWDKCMGVVTDYIKATHEADFVYSYRTTFIIALVIMILIGSASWAASIASSRRYSPIPHFLLGLILPWIYPAIILFTFDIKGHKEMIRAAEEERQAKEAAEAERQKNIALNTAAQQQEEAVEETGFNEARFTALARNVDGDNSGPWKVVFSGNEMLVTRIIEVLPEVVAVEVQGDNGSKFTMRIPYAKMEIWENA